MEFGRVYPEQANLRVLDSNRVAIRDVSGTCEYARKIDRVCSRRIEGFGP